MKLFEILLPLRDNAGNSTSKARDAFAVFVLREVGGISILSDVKGAWRDDAGKVYHDICVPYRVACDNFSIIVKEAHKLFADQKCLLWYTVADNVTFSEP